MSMRKCEVCQRILTEPGELCEHEQDPNIADLIERSSLGTPEAKALRDSVSRIEAQRLVERANAMDAPKFSHQEAMDIAARVEARAVAEERYPVSEKLRRAGVERRIIDAFLEWMVDQDLYITRASGAPVSGTYDDLLMRYLDIDTVALETERREMLNEQRKANER